jgi:hypothetical protein
MVLADSDWSLEYRTGFQLVLSSTNLYKRKNIAVVSSLVDHSKTIKFCLVIKGGLKTGKKSGFQMVIWKPEKVWVEIHQALLAQFFCD